MKHINYVLCERTDLLVLFWLFGGGILFFYILIPAIEIGFLKVVVAIMYYVIAVKFNNWREKYCEKCKKSNVVFPG